MGNGFKRPSETMESVKVAGRLAYLVNTWKMLTKEIWVLNTIQGYQIPLTGKPLQHQRPSESAFSKEQAALLSEEIVSLLQKGAISPISKEPGGFFSTIFLVPKKNGQMRPVINLKCLNQWVEAPHFKMAGIATLKDLLRLGDWMVKVDLKDAHFTIPIHLHHQQFLRFRVEGAMLSVYLPSIWPLLSSMDIHEGNEISDDSVEIMGIRAIVYIDNMLVMARTREEVNQYMEVLVLLLEALGFIVNQEKSHLIPAQELEFLGLSVDSQTFQLKLPSEKIRQISKEAAQLLKRESLSARQLSQFLGKLNAASQAMLVTPLFYRALQKGLQTAIAQGAQDYEHHMRLSKDAREELVWWQHHLACWNGRTVIQRQSQMKIQSDASLTGWDAVCDGVSTGGSWSLQERTNAHQLLGTPRSGFSNEILSKGASWNFSSTAIGQLHSSVGMGNIDILPHNYCHEQISQLSRLLST